MVVATLALLLAQFAKIAEPSTVLETLGNAARQKRSADRVSFQDPQKLPFSLQSRIPLARMLE